MSDAVLAHEPALRLGFFLGVFALMAVLESVTPRRPRTVSRWLRWLNNLGLVVLNTIVLRAVFPVAAVGLALLGEQLGWGLLNQLAGPAWLEAILAVVLLDLAIYLQHVLFHAVPALWRLHRMHHADLDIDVTTGARFHPVEILLSMGIKLAVIAALGAPALAVLVFEVLLNATSMFNHANVRIPTALERMLRWAVVTPDMHRVHHSVIVRETNSNFGFNLPWWDRLFGTYRAQPENGHAGMKIGIEAFRTPRDLWLDRMLIQPLHDAGSEYAFGRPAAPSAFSWLSTSALAERLADRSRPVVIDVRGAEEFVGPLGHIAGAINIAVGDLSNRRPKIEQFRDRPLILVCKTDKRSANAGELLREAGFDDIAILRGGMEQWNAEGLPVERNAP